MFESWIFRCADVCRMCFFPDALLLWHCTWSLSLASVVVVLWLAIFLSLERYHLLLHTFRMVSAAAIFLPCSLKTRAFEVAI